MFKKKENKEPTIFRRFDLNTEENMRKFTEALELLHEINPEFTLAFQFCEIDFSKLGSLDNWGAEQIQGYLDYLAEAIADHKKFPGKGNTITLKETLKISS